jgi:hypothetical protein
MVSLDNGGAILSSEGCHFSLVLHEGKFPWFVSVMQRIMATLMIIISTAMSVTALERREVFGNNAWKLWMVWKELCYRKAETLGDVEEAVSWWWNDLE